MKLKNLIKGWRAQEAKRQDGRPVPPSEPNLSEADLEKVRLLLRLVNDRSQPNINDLVEVSAKSICWR